MEDCLFNQERMREAMRRLGERLEATRTSELLARQAEEYQSAKSERDALAEDIRREYPVLSGKLIDLLGRIVESDKRLKRVNGQNAGSRNGQPYLNSAEIVARDAEGKPGNAMIPNLTDAAIPAFEMISTYAWSPQRRLPQPRLHAHGTVAPGKGGSDSKLQAQALAERLARARHD